MKVFTRKIEGYDVLTYSYRASRDMSFRFNLLSEVGAPWQEQAKHAAQALATERGATIQQIGLKATPWLVDALVLPVKHNPLEGRRP